MQSYVQEKRDAKPATDSSAEPKSVTRAGLKELDFAAGEAALSPHTNDPGPGGPKSGDPDTYTVKSGDTLAKIAKTCLGDKNRWQELAELNGISDPRKLRPDMVLRLPATKVEPMQTLNDRAEAMAAKLRSPDVAGDKEFWQRIEDALDNDPILILKLTDKLGSARLSEMAQSAFAQDPSRLGPTEVSRHLVSALCATNEAHRAMLEGVISARQDHAKSTAKSTTPKTPDVGRHSTYKHSPGVLSGIKAITRGR